MFFVTGRADAPLGPPDVHVVGADGLRRLIDRWQTVPPAGVLVDLTGERERVAAAVGDAAKRGLFRRTAMVALVDGPRSAADAARLGAWASVRCDAGHACPPALALSLCRSLGEPPSYSELEGAAGALREMRCRLLTRANEMKTRQAMVVHDLRSPLAVLRGALSALSEGPGLPADDARLLVLMDRASARLEALVDRLEQLYVCVAAPPEREALDAAELARDVVEQLQRSPDGRDKAIRVVAEGAHPLLAERQDLVRAIDNLLRNALRHARSDVEVEVRGDAKTVRLSVRDDGPGIAPAMREQLFEPFVRRGAGRMGLGLAIVKSAVERHGGTVCAREDEGGGACFAIELPRA